MVAHVSHYPSREFHILEHEELVPRIEAHPVEYFPSPGGNATRQDIGTHQLVTALPYPIGKPHAAIVEDALEEQRVRCQVQGRRSWRVADDAAASPHVRTLLEPAHDLEDVVVLEDHIVLQETNNVGLSAGSADALRVDQARNRGIVNIDETSGAIGSREHARDDRRGLRTGALIDNDQLIGEVPLRENGVDDVSKIVWPIARRDNRRYGECHWLERRRRCVGLPRRQTAPLPATSRMALRTPRFSRSHAPDWYILMARLAVGPRGRTMNVHSLAHRIPLLILGSVLLVLPDVVGAPWGGPVVVFATLVAIGVSLWMLHADTRLRAGLWLFAAAVAASAILRPPLDIVGQRHLAGIGVGMLAMAMIAIWCARRDDLQKAGTLFALASIGILIVGLLGTSVTKAKLVLGATPIVTGRYYSWLPELKLGLPGLEQSGGTVNPNALGGTAVLVLPTCIALIAAAAGRSRWRLGVGGTATIVAASVLILSRSRSALLAALLTAVVLAVRWRRGRRWIALALLLCAAGGAYTVARSSAASPGPFRDGLRFMRSTVLIRTHIWRDGVNRIRTSPWVGVGINQFHEVTADTSAHFINPTSHVAHVHNTALQVALDVGLPGLAGYVLLLAALLVAADRAARQGGPEGRLAAGAGLSLVAVHLFGVSDTIALGAKVGFFQWLCAGFILAAARIPSGPSGDPTRPDCGENRRRSTV